MTTEAEDLRREVSRIMTERGRPTEATLVSDTPTTIVLKFVRGDVAIFVDVDRKTGRLAHRVERCP